MTNRGKRILAAMLAALITVSGTGMAVVSAAEAAPAVEASAEETAANTVTEGNITYEAAEDGTLAVQQYTGTDTAVVIPEMVSGAKVTAIDGGAFAGCEEITEITLPKTVKTLGAGVFDDCRKLKTLTLQNDAPEADGVTLDADTEIIVLGKKTKGYDATPWSSCDVIFAHDLTGAVVEKIPEQVYTGAAILPELTVTDALGHVLRSGRDYTVAYGQNVAAGTAVAAIAGMGDYFGTMEQTFTITAKEGTELFRVEGVENKEYTGQAVTQNLSVYDGDTLLKENVDYTVSYEKNTNVGTAVAIITGIGNYSGVVREEFSIAKPFSAEAKISGLEDRVYTGQAQMQAITVTDGDTTLRENEDYTVVYENNTEAGTAAVTVTGIGKYTGTLTGTFNIAPVDIADVTIDPAAQVFTGSAITPDMVVTYNGTGLIIGKDYTITYKNNVNIGKATAVVTMRGNFTGEKTVTFQITPAEVTGLKVSSTTSSVKLTWDATPQATGYRIFCWSNEKNNWVLLKDQSGTSYTHSGLPSGTTYKYAVKAYKKVGSTKYSGTYPTLSAATKPAKLTGLKAKTTANSVTLTWDAVPGADAYLVYRRNESDTKWIRLGTTEALTYQDAGLAPGTTYKYAAKAYKMVDGREYSGTYPTLVTSTNPAKLTNLRAAKSTTTSIQVAWDAVPGADGYRVYRWDTAANKWKQLKEGNMLSFNDTGLETGVTYKYAAKAYRVVNGVRYYGTYPEVNLSTLPAKLTGLKAKTTTDSVTLTWHTVSGADGYQVFRWDNEKNGWKQIGNVTAQTFTDRNLTAATEYQYAVRGYRRVDGTLYRGAYPSLAVSTAPAELTGLKAAGATDTSVTLTWDAVEGATGYRIYRWDEAKNTWKLLKDGNMLTYTDSGLASGTTYKYAAKAYKTVAGVKYSGTYPTITGTTNPAKLTGLKASATSDSVVLKWNEVYGADSYEVFRWNAEKNKYLKIGEAAEETYTDSGLTAATEYKYRVRAYKKVDDVIYRGGYPTLTAATAPAKLTGLTAAKATTGTITLTWDSVPGATGYRAYRWNPSKNSWTLLKDISGGNVISYKAIGLAENTEYKFAVKAYKTAGGVKYGGAYPTITAKTKEKVLLSVPYLNQNAWPTGCEVTSTTMVLRYYGIPVSIQQVVNAMPKGNLYYYQGRLYGPHPDEAFIGSPSSYSGYGCYAGTIEYTMESLLPQGKAAKAVRGLSMSEVEKYLDNGQPVIFWASMYMGSTYQTSSWYVTGTNKVYTWTANEHCLVLVGYDDNYYYFNDPLQPNNNGGLVKWEKSLVAKRYTALGKQIVVVEDIVVEEPETPDETTEA